MYLFNNEKEITAILKRTMLGEAATLRQVESFGYAFSLIAGKKLLGYACFFEHGSDSDSQISCAVEHSDYESMLFGETYDGKDRESKIVEFVAFCQKNGIADTITRYYLSELQRIALGEKVTLESVSGSQIYGQLVSKLLDARKVVLSMDELAIFEALASLHKEFKAVDGSYPFGYSDKPFSAMYRTFGKRQKRFKSYCDFLDYLSECTLSIHRQIENEILIDTIEEKQLTKESL